MAKRYTRDGDVIVEDDHTLAYFIMGLGLGVAAGILFAPQSGEATRRRLRQKADEGAEFVRRKSSELQEAATEALERGKSQLQHQKDTLAAAVEAGRQAYREAAAADLD
jgi:gas vesicle protein